MRLPNREEAYVAREKVTLYPLNRDNPDGESKAIFFSRFGFDMKQWNTLAEAFRLHALRQLLFAGELQSRLLNRIRQHNRTARSEAPGSCERSLYARSLMLSRLAIPPYAGSARNTGILRVVLFWYSS